jgi:phosphohistidine phosphatase
MKIYLWRHGKAESTATSGKDEDRTLAPEGRNEIIDIADHCFEIKKMEKPEKIFTSPYARAKETAEMIQGFIGCEKGLEVVPAFKSGATFPLMLAALAQKAGGLKSCALVGHVPDLENFALGLLSGQGKDIRFKTGGIVLIQVDQLTEPFNAKLIFSLNPENIS